MRCGRPGAPLTDCIGAFPGNKRIAIVAAGLLLIDKSYEIAAVDTLYELVLGIAAGEIDEDRATRFLRYFTVPLPFGS